MLDVSAIDTETTGTDFFHGCKPWLITACSINNNDRSTAETNYWQGEVNPKTREVYWKPDVLLDFYDYVKSCKRVCMHGSLFDCRALSTLGLSPELFWPKLDDTMGMAHLVCSGDSHALKDLILKYHNIIPRSQDRLDRAVQSKRIEVEKKGWAIAKKGHPHFPGERSASWFKMDMWLCPELAIPYALDDVEYTLLLWRTFLYEIENNGWMDVYRIRLDLLPVYYEQTTTGVNFYQDLAQDRVDRIEKAKTYLREKVRKAIHVPYWLDFDQNKTIENIVHENLGIPRLYHTDNGKGKGWATDKDSLELYYKDYPNPVLKSIIRHSVLDTEQSYIKGYILYQAKDGAIHNNTNPTGTRETRTSSNSPNMQNVKKALKYLFGPPPGYIWLEFDLTNIEVCIWAYLTGNKELIQAFLDGIKLHDIVSDTLEPLYWQFGTPYQKHCMELKNTNRKEFKKTQLYGEIKSGTFAKLYGATDKKTNQTYFQTKSDNPPDGIALIKSKFEGFLDFIDAVPGEVARNLRKLKRPCVIVKGGYPLDVPVNEAYKGANYKIQGPAGFLMGLIMLAIHHNAAYQRTNSKIVMQIHDYLAIQMKITPTVYEDADEILSCIRGAGVSIVPSYNFESEIKHCPEKSNGFRI